MNKRLFGLFLCVGLIVFFLIGSKAKTRITIYTDDGNADYLVERVVGGEKTPEGMIQALIDNKMLPIQTRVVRYECKKVKSKMVGYLDLSQEFLDAISHTGTAGEVMYVYSVVNTFIKNLALDEVKLTVNGNEIEEGHLYYADNFEFYDHLIILPTKD